MTDILINELYKTGIANRVQIVDNNRLYYAYFGESSSSSGSGSGSSECDPKDDKAPKAIINLVLEPTDPACMPLSVGDVPNQPNKISLGITLKDYRIEYQCGSCEKCVDGKITKGFTPSNYTVIMKNWIIIDTDDIDLTSISWVNVYAHEQRHVANNIEIAKKIQELLKSKTQNIPCFEYDSNNETSIEIAKIKCEDFALTIVDECENKFIELVNQNAAHEYPNANEPVPREGQNDLDPLPCPNNPGKKVGNITNNLPDWVEERLGQ